MPRPDNTRKQESAGAVQLDTPGFQRIQEQVAVDTRNVVSSEGGRVRGTDGANLSGGSSDILGGINRFVDAANSLEARVQQKKDKNDLEVQERINNEIARRTKLGEAEGGWASGEEGAKQRMQLWDSYKDDFFDQEAFKRRRIELMPTDDDRKVTIAEDLRGLPEDEKINYLRNLQASGAAPASMSQYLQDNIDTIELREAGMNIEEYNTKVFDSFNNLLMEDNGDKFYEMYANEIAQIKSAEGLYSSEALIEELSKQAAKNFMDTQQVFTDINITDDVLVGLDSGSPVHQYVEDRYAKLQMDMEKKFRNAFSAIHTSNVADRAIKERAGNIRFLKDSIKNNAGEMFTDPIKIQTTIASIGRNDSPFQVENNQEVRTRIAETAQASFNTVITNIFDVDNSNYKNAREDYSTGVEYINKWAEGMARNAKVSVSVESTGASIDEMREQALLQYSDLFIQNTMRDVETQYNRIRIQLDSGVADSQEVANLAAAANSTQMKLLSTVVEGANAERARELLAGGLSEAQDVNADELQRLLISDVPPSVAAKMLDATLESTTFITGIKNEITKQERIMNDVVISATQQQESIARAAAADADKTNPYRTASSVKNLLRNLADPTSESFPNIFNDAVGVPTADEIDVRLGQTLTEEPEREADLVRLADETKLLREDRERQLKSMHPSLAGVIYANRHARLIHGTGTKFTEVDMLAQSEAVSKRHFDDFFNDLSQSVDFNSPTPAALSELEQLAYAIQSAPPSSQDTLKDHINSVFLNDYPDLRLWFETISDKQADLAVMPNGQNIELNNDGGYFRDLGEGEENRATALKSLYDQIANKEGINAIIEGTRSQGQIEEDRKGLFQGNRIVDRASLGSLPYADRERILEAMLDSDFDKSEVRQLTDNLLGSKGIMTAFDRALSTIITSDPTISKDNLEERLPGIVANDTNFQTILHNLKTVMPNPQITHSVDEESGDIFISAINIPGSKRDTMSKDYSVNEVSVEPNRRFGTFSSVVGTQRPSAGVLQDTEATLDFRAARSFSRKIQGTIDELPKNTVQTKYLQSLQASPALALEAGSQDLYNNTLNTVVRSDQWSDKYEGDAEGERDALELLETMLLSPEVTKGDILNYWSETLSDRDLDSDSRIEALRLVRLDRTFADADGNVSIVFGQDNAWGFTYSDQVQPASYSSTELVGLVTNEAMPKVKSLDRSNKMTNNRSVSSYLSSVFPEADQLSTTVTLKDTGGMNGRSQRKSQNANFSFFHSKGDLEINDDTMYSLMASLQPKSDITTTQVVRNRGTGAETTTEVKTREVGLTTEVDRKYTMTSQEFDSIAKELTASVLTAGEPTKKQEEYRQIYEAGAERNDPAVRFYKNRFDNLLQQWVDEGLIIIQD